MGMAELAAQGAMPTDDPNLINITTLEQLNAIRYDLDGNGRVDQAVDIDKYNGTMAPFTSTQTTCTGGCQGYELRNNLDFDDVDHVLVGLQLSRWAKHAGDPAMHPLASGVSIGGPPSFTGTAVPGGWVPIGDSSHPFTATFDGNRRRISNLYIHTSTIADVGLFGVLGSMGVIHYLGLEGGTVKKLQAGQVGALVGTAKNNSTISACYATGNVTGTLCSSVGGLVGSTKGLVSRVSNNTTISACYVTGNITGTLCSRVGGLVGSTDYTTISACYVTGNVTAQQTTERVGGLVGFANGRSLIACYATGNIVATSSKKVGGLVGENYAVIAACYAIGNINGAAGSQVGSLVGENSYTILNCYFNSERSGIAVAVPYDPFHGERTKTTAQLQRPTSYTDLDVAISGTAIYSNWNIDIDNKDRDAMGVVFAGTTDPGWSTEPDNPWDFGTSSQYPVLQVDFNGDGRPSAYEFGGQDRVDPSPSPSPGDGDDGSSLVAITSMSPNSGPVGTEVTLRGRGFSMIPARNSVIFNGVADLSTDDVLVRSLTPISSTEMTIRVPEGALSGRIRLTVEAETAASSEDFTVRSDGSVPDVAVFRVPDLGNGKLGVYPNPADRWIHFKGLSAASRYRYLLYTIAGRGSLSGTLVDQHTIEIASLSAGYYVLVLQDESLTEVLREAIVIE